MYFDRKTQLLLIMQLYFKERKPIMRALTFEKYHNLSEYDTDPNF